MSATDSEPPASPGLPSGGRRAFWIGVANGALFLTGQAFVEPDTVLSGLVYRLTGSTAAIGLAATAVRSGWLWPQLLFSGRIENYARKKTVYKTMGIGRIACMTALPAIFFILGNRGWLVYGVMVFLLFANTSFSGVAVPAFMDIVAKAVGLKRLGAFFGTRRFLGGIGGICAGLVVRRILSAESSIPFPYSYGLLFTIGLFFMASAVLIFFTVDEPVETVEKPRPLPLRKVIRRAVGSLRTIPDYRRLLFFNVTWSVAVISGPFYVAYAMSSMGATAAETGVYLTASMCSMVVSGLLLGHISYRYGNPALLRICSILGLVAPATALLVGSMVSAGVLSYQVARWPYYCVFIFNAAAFNGGRIATPSYLLELSPPDRRPSHTGLMNTILAPLTALPFAAGVLLRIIPYGALFLVSAAAAATALIISLRLEKR